jgi:hypothetical protein
MFAYEPDDEVEKEAEKGLNCRHSSIIPQLTLSLYFLLPAAWIIAAWLWYCGVL